MARHAEIGELSPTLSKHVTKGYQRSRSQLKELESLKMGRIRYLGYEILSS
jgi:hypothetical protein